MLGDELKPLVIDNGSCMIKAGMVGDETPKAVFRNVIGVQKAKPMFNEQSYVGSAALSITDVSSLKYPIQDEYVVNWDDMERIWNYTFFDQLRVSPEEHTVLLTESPLAPKYNREKMVQIMFETFSVPSMYVANPAVLSLYASNRMTGTVVDSGYTSSYAVPVFEGHALPYATSRLGGNQLFDYIFRILIENYDSVSVAIKQEAAKQIKEQLTYTWNFNKEYRRYSYELPGKQEINMETIRSQIPEELFQPNTVGIAEMAHKSILKCDVDIQKDVYQNIVLAGGSTMLHEFPERINEELKRFAPTPIRKNFKIVAPNDRIHSAWIGGSMLASLSTFQQMCITKEEYEEFGPCIVRKCF